MSYHLEGHFVEACDCTVICPCWLDDDPDGGHCTGLIAWEIEQGSVNGQDVSGRRVVSVATHLGNRRNGSTTTSVLYVDAPADAEGERQFRELAAAFAGDINGGPLHELAAVSGVVVGAERAVVSLTADGQGRGSTWSVSVHPTGPGALAVVEATGTPRYFEGEDRPLTLQHTALSHELAVPADQPGVVAQRGETLRVNVGALPAGTLEVAGRSGMRGRFSYSHTDTGLLPTEPQPVEPQPVEPQPVEPQPVEPQPVEPQPVEPQPVEPQPSERQPDDEPDD